VVTSFLFFFFSLFLIEFSGDLVCVCVFSVVVGNNF